MKVQNIHSNNWHWRQLLRIAFISWFSLVSTDKLIISDPVDFHDRSFMAHLNQLPWAEPLFTRRVEQTVLTGKHMIFCRVSNDSISVVSALTWLTTIWFSIRRWIDIYLDLFQAAEIIRYPNFTALVKEASHCPYHYFMDNLQAAQPAVGSTGGKPNNWMGLVLSLAASSLASWALHLASH